MSVLCIQTYGMNGYTGSVRRRSQQRGLRFDSRQLLPNRLPPLGILWFKAYEAVLAAGEEIFAHIDARLRVKGG